MLQTLEDQECLWCACERTSSRVVTIRGVEVSERLPVGVDEHGECPLRRWTDRIIETGDELKAAAVDGLGIRRSEELQLASQDRCEP